MRSVIRSIQWIRGRVARGSFAHAVGVLVLGTGLAQLLSILASPVLTRLYTPTQFGVFAVYLSLVNLLAAVAPLGYEMAVPLPRSERAAANVLVVALGLVFCTTLLSTAVLGVAGGAITRWTHAEALRPYLWLLPLGLLGLAGQRTLGFWAMRVRIFLPIARARVGQGLTKISMQLVLGLFGRGALGLAFGDVAGRAAGFASMARFVGRRGRGAISGVSRRGLRYALLRYRRFPLLASGSRLLGVGGYFLPPLLVAGAYRSHIAGWFVLAMQVIGLPLGLLAQAVAQAYVGRASQLVREDLSALRRLFFKTLRGLALLGLIPGVILALFGPDLFALVFGGPWREAGIYSRLLAPMLVAQFVVDPLAHTLNIFERQDLQLLWEFGRLGVILVALVALPLAGAGPRTAVGAYSLLIAGAYVVLGLVYVVQLDGRTRRALRSP